MRPRTRDPHLWVVQPPPAETGDPVKNDPAWRLHSRTTGRRIRWTVPVVSDDDLAALDGLPSGLHETRRVA
jgi:hypothetical protein